MTITVYSKPECPQCVLTKSAFDKKNAEYAEVDVTEDASGLALVQELGYFAAPVVVVSDAEGETVEHWSGLRPDRINKLVKTLTESRPVFASV